eukprot:Protomagalhaensia_sp_Gyna_25__2359@NODE_22_length_7715_cov_56_973033_g15_i0_p1_GENE_NODE_22_length_7715_cov_56_973033_g15_i0NODE_22_length_7715_cov_56_973033_g15_i0_p1_ORF_typecomplete_len625_score71_40MBOAT/PF03062_19/4_4e02MBOAT/PF03062_19/7_9e02MBOAT/PF03062_19/3_3e27_NODE_22_length_7715_cov_56_973033_g15_i032395113
MHQSACFYKSLHDFDGGFISHKVIQRLWAVFLHPDGVHLCVGGFSPNGSMSAHHGEAARPRRVDFMQRKFGLTAESHFALLVAPALLFILYCWLGVRRVVSTEGVELSQVRYNENWPALLRWEDRSDFQWFGFRENLSFTFGVILLHVFLSHVVSLTFQKSPTILAAFHAVFGSITAIYLHGAAVFIAFFLIASFSLVSQLCRSQRATHLVPILAWTLAILTLSFTSAASTFNDFVQSLDLMYQRSPLATVLPLGKPLYPIERCINLLVLRLLSFTLDRYWAVKPPSNSYNSQMVLQSGNYRDEPMNEPLCITSVAQSRCAQDYNILFFLAYALFLPLYIAGPIIPFNAFCHALGSRASPKRIWVFKSCSRWIAFYLLTEIVSTRMILTSAFTVEQANHEYWSLLRISEILILFGLILVYTWLKFSVLWDGFRIWSVAVGVYCPANLLCFVFNHYSVQHFWKTWHASFHLWITRYLYVPLGGSKRKVRCSLLIFLFVALWHRINLDFVWWAVITVATIVFELNLETSGGHNFHRKIFRVQNGCQYTWLILGTELVSVLLIVANLIGFGCGRYGLLRIGQEMWARPAETISTVLFFVMFGFLHSSYLIERDASPFATRRPHIKSN